MASMLVAASVLASELALPPAAHAEAPVQAEVVYTADLAQPIRGGADRKLRYLDNLDLVADADLDALVGWHGARAHGYVLVNNGAHPNTAAGSLEGVNNIEVGKAGVRLFEAWAEQDIGSRGALLVGLYDLNSEFYALDSAGLLLGPPFGIGTELAATGRNGPSIFPSSALAVRANLRLGAGESYVRVAAFNAHAATLGDPGGVDVGFHDGLLLIGEAGLGRPHARLSLGLWTYTRAREAYYSDPADPDPQRRHARGAYVQGEFQLPGAGESAFQAFVRAGFSRGGTTPFAWSASAGLFRAPVLAARPGSSASLGVHYAGTSQSFRQEVRALGQSPASSEYTLEATYSDRLADWLTVQPDLQLVCQPGGLRGAPAALIGTVRLTLTLP
ncbi:carbohydrate porin [uncultured Novosphingobium sp.]|uniref:carbohydrate porin n=1 Tax=uncultured Novosphingobium sp. TaxID=292277 RepID=UPI0025977093|nr:carbohydrate porin [uncultured Novosphingobium sp.]